MVVVVGMARSGLAVAGLILTQGFDVFASDLQADPPLADEFQRQGIPYETGAHSQDRFNSADEIVVSPGVPLDIEPLEEARRRGIPVVSELEVASRYLKGDVVAITGSNGKTTTTALLGQILSTGSRPVQVGGNIGTPVSAMVPLSGPETINVIEVSSFQLDAMQLFRPHVGVLLNITPDHMDRYPSFEAYRSSKFRLFENQTAEDYAVINLDDPNVFPVPLAVRSQQLHFSRLRGLEQGAWVGEGQLILEGMPMMPVRDLSLRGGHNVENVLATLLVAERYGITVTDTVRAVRAFRPIEHRLETVAIVNDVEFINDSKATNVDSAVKAVEAFTERMVVILGGQDKGGSFEPLIAAMRGKVRLAVLIGAAAGKFEGAIGGAVPSSRAASMKEAVDLARESAEPGDIVLLAPACASFDMYSNYEERGNDFKSIVKSFVN